MARAAVFLVVIVGVLSLIAAGAVAGKTMEEQIGQAFRAGKLALQQREFGRAAAEFKRVLALDPTIVEAEVNLGLAYQGSLDYESAARCLAKAVRERPNLLGPTVILGMDYLKLGSPAKAVPFLQRALQLDASNRDAREALASAYLAEENFQGAAEQFRQLAKLNPDQAEAWYRLGHQYLDLAARVAYRGAHLYRESAWGHRFLGDLLLERGRWKHAREEYEKALASEPQQPGLHAAMGQTFLREQKLEEAEAEFQQELQRDAHSEPAWMGLASLAVARNRGSAALECLQNVWEISPDYLAAQREFPSVELPQETVQNVAAGVQSAPEGPAKHFLLAALLVAGNQPAEAERAWNSFEQDVAGWRERANAEAAGEPCQAHRYARCIEALKGRKLAGDAERLLLGKMYFTMQQYEAAADTLTEVQGATRENAEASYWLARSYQAEGAEAYARLQESFPESWRAYELRAEGFALRQDVDNAAKHYQRALQLRPDQPELHEAAGEFYLDHHNRNQAHNELEKAFALDPTRTRTLCLLGRAYLQNGENERALSYLQRALRLQPDLTEANRLLGTAYVRLGRFADAVPRLERAAPADHYGNLHYELYLAYRKLGQADLARKALTRSQALRRSSLEHDQALVMGSPEPELEAQ